MFHCKPKGRYHHGLCTVIASFWFSTLHCLRALMPFWLSTDTLLHKDEYVQIRIDLFPTVSQLHGSFFPQDLITSYFIIKPEPNNGISILGIHFAYINCCYVGHTLDKLSGCQEQPLLEPMYSFGKWYKWKNSLMGISYRVVWVLKALWIFLSETINFLRKLHKTNIFGMPPENSPI